jgi:ribokinase
MARVAVVGHVEWVDFLAVEHLPQLGQITPAERLRVNAGGGAVVAAVVLARLGAEVDFYGAVGSDENGERAVAELEGFGITVHVAHRPGPTRQVITLIDAAHERSILTIGERLSPAGADDLDWARLADAAGVYFTAGDLGALHAARAAGALVTTPRLAENLPTIDVTLDALVYSEDDAAEVGWAAGLAPHARLSVVTEGPHGGYWSGESSGRWVSAPAPGAIVDSYGAGDSFAAGFTYGLAVSGDPAERARRTISARPPWAGEGSGHLPPHDSGFCPTP